MFDPSLFLSEAQILMYTNKGYIHRPSHSVSSVVVYPLFRLSVLTVILCYRYAHNPTV
jgi:hypothetical protein